MMQYDHVPAHLEISIQALQIIDASFEYYQLKMFSNKA